MTRPPQPALGPDFPQVNRLITADFTHGLSNTWAVGQGEVTGGGCGLGEFDAQFPRTRLSVIFESGGFQV